MVKYVGKQGLRLNYRSDKMAAIEWSKENPIVGFRSSNKELQDDFNEFMDKEELSTVLYPIMDLFGKSLIVSDIAMRSIRNGGNYTSTLQNLAKNIKSSVSGTGNDYNDQLRLSTSLGELVEGMKSNDITSLIAQAKKFSEYYQDSKENVQTTLTGPNKGRKRTDIWNIVWYSKLGHK